MDLRPPIPIKSKKIGMQMLETYVEQQGKQEKWLQGTLFSFPKFLIGREERTEKCFCHLMMDQPSLIFKNKVSTRA